MGNARNEGNVIFRGMSPDSPGNVAKHSGKCSQTFRGMSPNIHSLFNFQAVRTKSEKLLSQKVIRELQGVFIMSNFSDVISSLQKSKAEILDKTKKT